MFKEKPETNGTTFQIVLSSVTLTPLNFYSTACFMRMCTPLGIRVGGGLNITFKAISQPLVHGQRHNY